MEKLIAKKINQAILKYKMIEEGDKVLLALSGGKDSMTLAYMLNKIAEGRYHTKFQFHCLNIKNDLKSTLDKNDFESYLKKHQIPFTILEAPVLGRLKPGRKMNCYWCSSQRRMELMKFADEQGFNKIALGHHMDDILETFFMNMAFKGEMSTMLPVLKFDNYDQTIIRPLALVKEKEIISYADKSGLSKIACTCNYDTQSKRKEMRSVINMMAEKDEAVRDNLFKAMSNPNLRYMID